MLKQFLSKALPAGPSEPPRIHNRFGKSNLFILLKATIPLNPRTIFQYCLL